MIHKIRKTKFIVLLLSILLTLTFTFCKKGSNQNRHVNIPEIEQNNAQRNRQVESNVNELNLALSLQNSLRNVAKSITPAVVNIRAERIVRTRTPRGGRDFFFFFRRRMPRQRRGKAIGSGFIINKKGYIITNSHVVKNATKITVVLQDEREFKASVVGIDNATDIALLKISPGSTALPACPLGNSETIQVGDFAVAIGNPFGLRGTVTFGIISAKGRSELNDANATLKNFIQTDVPINRGNSGGPLLNIKGQVIGVNTMIYSPSGGNIGIGFAIPINIVKNVVRQLIKKGRVDRGFIGAMIQPLDSATARHFGIRKTDGVIISSVKRGGPADKAGLRSGDIILEVNGKKIKKFAILKRIISDVLPGHKVKMKILRKGKKIYVTLTVGRMATTAQNNDNRQYYQGGGSEDEPLKDREGKAAWLGMNLANASNSSDEGFGFGQRRRSQSSSFGVQVTDVISNSAAEKAGIKVGDIILSINYKRIKNMAALKYFIKKNKVKKSFFIKVKRGSRIIFITLEKNPPS